MKYVKVELNKFNELLTIEKKMNKLYEDCMDFSDLCGDIIDDIEDVDFDDDFKIFESYLGDGDIYASGEPVKPLFEIVNIQKDIMDEFLAKSNSIRCKYLGYVVNGAIIYSLKHELIRLMKQLPVFRDIDIKVTHFNSKIDVDFYKNDVPVQFEIY